MVSVAENKHFKDSHLELVLVALQRLHDHAHSLHGAFQPAVHTVEAVHAARDVGQQPQTLGLLLRGTGLLRCLKE